LQVNIRWKALDEIYKIYMLLHRSDLNISPGFRHVFVVSNVRNAKTFVIFQISLRFSLILMKFARIFFKKYRKTLQLLEISRFQFRFNFQIDFISNDLIFKMSIKFSI